MMPKAVQIDVIHFNDLAEYITDEEQTDLRRYLFSRGNGAMLVKLGELPDTYLESLRSKMSTLTKNSNVPLWVYSGMTVIRDETSGNR